MIKIIDIRLAKNNAEIRSFFSIIRDYIHSIDLRVFSTTGVRISGPFLRGERVWIEAQYPAGSDVNLALYFRGMGSYLKRQGVDVNKYMVGNRIFTYDVYAQDQKEMEIDRLVLNNRFAELLNSDDEESRSKLQRIASILVE